VILDFIKTNLPDADNGGSRNVRKHFRPPNIHIPPAKCKQHSLHLPYVIGEAMTRRKRWSLGLFGIIGSVSVAVLLLDQNRACAFESLQHAHVQIVQAGYRCVSDREDGQLQYSFVVSRDALTRADVVAMRKTGPMGPEWSGRVWIVAPVPDSAIETAPGDVPPRVWGRVWAFGDANLLDEIERQQLGGRFFGFLD
jgi:hypothetical protein